GGAEIVATQCSGGQLVGTGRATQPQVNTAGIKRFERAELLSNGQWGMIGKHDATRTDADAISLAGHMANQYRSSRASYVFHVVVLGKPDAVIAELLDVSRRFNGAGNGRGSIAALDDNREIEGRKLDLFIHGYKEQQ